MTEAINPVGMHRTEDHLYYWMGEGPYTSVTTALKMFDKSDALVGWAKKETASFAMRHLDTLIAHRLHNTPVPECDPCAVNAARRRPVGQQEAARMWVSSISDYKRDAAADLGTRVHLVAETLANGGDDEIEPELIPFAEQYQRFMRSREVEYLAVEYMGLNETYDYAGTGDIIARLPGHPRLTGNVAIDIKTHTKETPIPDTYYPETAMQLAACARFDFIGREGDPYRFPMPDVDSYAVLLLGRDDYRLIPYAVTDWTFGAFLACLKLHRWKNGEGKTIVGSAA